MVADGHDGAGEGDDCSGDLAVSQHTNGQHSCLAGQPSLRTPPSASASYHFPSSALQPLVASSADAAHFTGKDSMIDAEGTGHGPTILSNTVEEGSTPSRRISATPTLCVDTHTTSRQDAVREPRRPSLRPVSPESSLQLKLPFSPLSSTPSPRARARNVDGQPENSGSAMELQSMAASAQQQRLTSGSSKKSNSKITVSQVLETDDDLGTRPQSTKKPFESLALPHYESWIKDKADQSGVLSRLRAMREDIRKKILGIHEIPPSKDGRHINVDRNRREPLIDERTGRTYIKNTITSSRYTLYNFVPRQLFAQFSKLANFYFLCVSILQMIPGLSTTGSYTTIVPLAFFVIISMAKEGYDDLRRYKLDRAENRKTALVLSEQRANATSTDDVNSDTTTPGERMKWVITKWEDIEVGDIVKLARDEAAPADLTVLHTSGADGVAYVETMALDGETNLKSKQTLPQLARSCRNVEGIASCKAHIVVEDPNLDLYKFEGKMTVGNKTLPLTNNEIIYRGSILRNTSDAFGIVVYSGEECKIRMNATKNPRTKAVSKRVAIDP